MAFTLYAISDRARAQLTKVCGVVAAVASLPLIGMGIFFVSALLQERGGWHPAVAEAVIVPLIWAGSVLLPICAWRLIRQSRLPRAEQPTLAEHSTFQASSDPARQGPGQMKALSTEDQAKMNEAEWSNPANWTGPAWLSVYFSKRDSRVWVPKQIPALGWTVNLGNGRGAFMTLVIVLGSFALFLSVMISTLLTTSSPHADPGENVQKPGTSNSNVLIEATNTAASKVGVPPQNVTIEGESNGFVVRLPNAEVRADEVLLEPSNTVTFRSNVTYRSR